MIMVQNYCIGESTWGLMAPAYGLKAGLAARGDEAEGVNGKGGGPIAPGVPTVGRLIIGFDVKGVTAGVALTALEDA